MSRKEKIAAYVLVFFIAVAVEYLAKFAYDATSAEQFLAFLIVWIPFSMRVSQE